MKVSFDFDSILTEVQQDNTPLVPKETMDDKIDFLKQFKEYWEFEKNFKYNSTFDTAFKKVSKEIGLNQDQMIDVMKDLIDDIIGKAANAIGLEWKLINDGDYLFGLYKKGNDKRPVILVPYDFKFSVVKDKIIDWLVRQKKNEHKKPKVQIIESLSSRVKDKFNKRKDGYIEDVTLMDRETATQVIQKFADENYRKIDDIDIEKEGNLSMDEYVTLDDNDKNKMWLFPLFYFSSCDEPQMLVSGGRGGGKEFKKSAFYNYTVCLNVYMDGEDVFHMEIWKYTFLPSYRSCERYVEETERIIGNRLPTGKSVNALFKLLKYAKENSEIFKLAYNPEKVASEARGASFYEAYKVLDEASAKIVKLMEDFYKRTKDESMNEELCEDSFDYDSNLSS